MWNVLKGLQELLLLSMCCTSNPCGFTIPDGWIFRIGKLILFAAFCNSSIAGGGKMVSIIYNT